MQVTYNRKKKVYQGWSDNGDLVTETATKMTTWAQLVRHTDQGLYDLMTQAENFIPPKLSLNSAIIVASNGVNECPGKLAQVASQNGSKTYTISGRHGNINQTAHCDCDSYLHGRYTIAQGAGRVVTCKHIIALRFAIALGLYQVKTDDQFGEILLSAISADQDLVVDVANDVNWG